MYPALPFYFLPWLIMDLVGSLRWCRQGQHSRTAKREGTWPSAHFMGQTLGTSLDKGILVWWRKISFSLVLDSVFWFNLQSIVSYLIQGPLICFLFLIKYGGNSGKWEYNQIRTVGNELYSMCSVNNEHVWYSVLSHVESERKALNFSKKCYIIYFKFS